MLVGRNNRGDNFLQARVHDQMTVRSENELVRLHYTIVFHESRAVPSQNFGRVELGRTKPSLQIVPRQCQSKELEDHR